MKITDWFDCDDIKHITAWEYLKACGWWPKGFLPKDIDLTCPGWADEIEERMIDKWCKHVIKKGKKK